MPTQKEFKNGLEPGFLFDYLETGNPENAFSKDGVFSFNYLVSKSSYFSNLDNIRDIMFTLLETIDYINSRGLMHRDIKPANLVITTDGVLKLLDFDLADFYHENKKQDLKVASRGYQAPELLLKQRNYDYRMDVYSTGCIMLAMLFSKETFFTGPKN
jgi:serine/threonine protein kinase